jgi:hypothetical protein
VLSLRTIFHVVIPAFLKLSSQHDLSTLANLSCACICPHSDLSRDKRRRREETAGCGDLHLQWPHDAYQEGSELGIPNLIPLF